MIPAQKYPFPPWHLKFQLYLHTRNQNHQYNPHIILQNIPIKLKDHIKLGIKNMKNTQNTWT